MGKFGVERFELGPLGTNCYLVYSGNEAIVIDPGWPTGIEEVASRVKQLELHVKAIVATHGHPDHVLGASEAKRLLGAPFLIHRADAEMALRAREAAEALLGVKLKHEVPAPDGYLDEGDTIEIGGVRLRVLWMPGHSPGSIVLYGGGAAFVGDLVFRGSIGRVDLPGASPHDMARSLRRLAELPGSTTLYPGHGPATTLAAELETNALLIEFVSSL
ncbi:MAG: MBL fold metallo-hydrolase [Thermoproteota archaeon]